MPVLIKKHEAERVLSKDALLQATLRERLLSFSFIFFQVVYVEGCDRGFCFSMPGSGRLAAVWKFITARNKAEK